MDFVANIGQSYLELKANQVPYMLEGVATKQLKNAFNPQKEGSGKGYKAPVAETVDESEDARSTAPSRQSKASAAASPQKDEEIARLRRQLAQAKVSKSREPSIHSKSGAEKAPASSPPKQSHSGGLGAMSGGIEKGQFVSNARQKARGQLASTRAPKERAGIQALDGRIEKGQISTKSRPHLREGNGRFEAEKRAGTLMAMESGSGHRRASSSHDQGSRVRVAREKHGPETGSRRKSNAASEAYSSSEAEESQRPSRAKSVGHGSEVARSRRDYDSDGGESKVSRATTERHGSEAGRSGGRHGSSSGASHKLPSVVSYSPRSEAGRSQRASSASGVSPMGRVPLTTEVVRGTLDPDAVSSRRRPLDRESEHGGSAALLHARDMRRKSHAFTGSTIEEEEPVDRRPEVRGPGFRPRRVGIVEVEEDVPSRRNAPLVRQLASKTLRARGGTRDKGDHVVEVGHRGQHTLYKVR